MFDMFSPEYVINYALGLLPTWVPWAIAGSGIALFLLSHIFNKLIPLLYRFVITILCFILVGLGFWLQGRQDILIEGKHEVEKIVTEQKVITKVVVQKFIEKQKEIEVVHDKIAAEINTKDDHMCDVPESFVRVHDSAAQNTVPGPANGIDGTSSGIALSQVEHTIADNYELYHKVAEQLKSLQEWVTKQKELNP